jgi:DNA-binding NtrC family response regulator
LPSVLCISAIKSVADRYKAALERAGYSVATACGLQEAVNLLAEKRFNAVLIGPYMSGKAALAAQIKSYSPLTCVLALLRERERALPGVHCLPTSDDPTLVSAVNGVLQD